MGILIIEDDFGTSEICKAAISQFGTAWVASSLSEAKKILQTQHVELIVLDILLPDGNGVDFYNQISTENPNPPQVVFLTSKDEVYSKVTAFSIGAIDYISKPFNAIEFQARVKSHYNRLKKPTRNFEWNVYRAEPESMRAFVSKDGLVQQIECTSIEFKVLVSFLGAPTKIFSRDELIDRVWGNGTHISERNIDSHIARLRKKLTQFGGGIDSIRGAGYRLSEVSKNEKKTG